VVASNENYSGSHAHGADHQICDAPRACLGCLAVSGLGAELTDSQVKALFEIAELRRLSKGDVLIAEGEYDDHLFTIARGEFEVTRGEGADREVQLVRLGPGTITGELAFLDGLKRTASVRAVTDGSCVIALKRECLEPMLAVDPQLVYKVMKAILRSAHRTVGQMDKVYLDMVRYVQG